jgi:DNA-binding CsgD family transcriptional regulator
MIRSDEHWLSLIDSLHSAAIGDRSWNAALEGLADATGSRSMQLCGVDSKTSVTFNTITNIDPGIDSLFADSLSYNPRVKAADTAPVLNVMTDADFITADEIKSDRFYQELAIPWDIPWICLTTLERSRGIFVALAAIRSHREDHITSAQREIFSSFAPHVRAAVRTRLALEAHGIAVLTAATESLAIPLFICDRSGRVGNLTQASVSLVTSGRGLELRAGRLYAAQPADDKALSDAIGAAIDSRAKPGPPALRTVIIRDQNAHSTLVLDVFTLPSRGRAFDCFSFEPRALVVARGPRGDDARKVAILDAVYGLTSAECDVGLLIAQGKTPEAIALNRGVTVGTVRAQIKTILAKMDVSRQIDLVLLFGRL